MIALDTLEGYDTVTISDSTGVEPSVTLSGNVVPSSQFAGDTITFSSCFYCVGVGFIIRWERRGVGVLDVAGSIAIGDPILVSWTTATEAHFNHRVLLQQQGDLLGFDEPLSWFFVPRGVNGTEVLVAGVDAAAVANVSSPDLVINNPLSYSDLDYSTSYIRTGCCLCVLSLLLLVVVVDVPPCFCSLLFLVVVCPFYLLSLPVVVPFHCCCPFLLLLSLLVVVVPSHCCCPFLLL